MIDNLSTVMGSLSGLNLEELNKVIEAAQKQKEKAKIDQKCAAAANLIEAFNAYKKATGENEIILQDFYDCDFNGNDLCVRIDDLYLDSYGNICQKVLY